MKTVTLEQFGLNKNDISVYQALFILGKSKTGTIIKESGVTSSSCYNSLSILIKKGLVSYEVRNNIRYYQPEPLETIITKSRETTHSLEQLSKELQALKPKSTNRNEITIFEGYHGVRRAFLEHLEQISGKDTLKIIGFGARIPSKKALSKFLQEINSFASKKHPRMIILLDENLRGKSQTIKMHRDKIIHYLPTTYFGPTAYNISKNEVLISTWGKELLVVRIRNPILVESFTANFDFLLKQVEK